MMVDGSSFLKRAYAFLRALRQQRFPNASSLAREMSCSVNTAQRVIYRLRDEYLVPIEYDASKRGYYLLDETYTLPEALPPGRDELIALLFAATILETLGLEDICKRLEGIYNAYAEKNGLVARDIGPISKVFSSELTEIAEASEQGLLELANYASVGEELAVTYESPWSGKGQIHLRGKIKQVHFADGVLYARFLEESGKSYTLNSSFISKVEKLETKISIIEQGEDNFLAGLGVWADEEIVEIRVCISPPAAQYYATKTWHISQSDSYDGDTLVRTFKSAISPELVRKLLSIGEFLTDVKPKSLRVLLQKSANQILTQLS